MNKAELGRRAVACPHWDWDQILSHGVTGNYKLREQTLTFESFDGETLPDFEDECSVDSLMALVRKVYGRGLMVTRQDDNEWWIDLSPWVAIGPCATEAEVLVAALEVAP